MDFVTGVIVEISEIITGAAESGRGGTGAGRALDEPFENGQLAIGRERAPCDRAKILG